MIATSITQSKKLIAAGLNPDTADMIYTSFLYESIKDKQYYVLEVRNFVENFEENEIPAWSLGELIDISCDHGWNSDFQFKIGENTSYELLDECVQFIIDMLNDTSDDNGVLKFNKEYKV